MSNSGCIVYLVNHTPKAILDFKRSLALLKQNYLNQFPTDLICFHESGLSAEERNNIEQISKVKIHWEEIKFEIPPWVNPARIPTFKSPLGYCHMCRFYSITIFIHPALTNYEYHLRLDTDSEILSPVTFDIFDTAKKLEIEYGYIDDTIRDFPDFIIGLRECATKVADVSKINIGTTYYTNIELCHRPWFQQRRELARQVDEAGLFYYCRCGDHTLRFIEVNLYTKPEQRWLLPIHYRHQGFEYRKGKL